VKYGFLALVAQLVEHFLGKEEVTGSIPVEGSMRLFLVLYFVVQEERAAGRKSGRINDVEGQI
jgi:hypothetical protein